MKPVVSIIIPTLHRKLSLLCLLKSLEKEIDRKTTEIIIVEQGDNNGMEYKKYAKNNNISLHYYFLKDHNTAKAKNVGASHAKGKFFVFYDDDVVLHKYAVRNMIKNFRNKKVGGAGGRVLTPGQPVEPLRTDVGKVNALGVFSDGFSSAIRQEIDTLIGCNMAFPSDVFRESHGFDEQFTGAIREDSDLSLRVKALGYKIIFDPTSVVTHMRESTGGGRKSEGRLNWYFHFFSNETYFFLKHLPKALLPVFWLTKTEWILRCIFGFGREVSLQSFVTPFAGFMDGVRKYRNYDHRR